MSGRHRKLAAAPEPTPQALSAAVTEAVDAAQAVVDDRAGFEESVLAVFCDVVRRLDDDHRMEAWRAEPEISLPAVTAAATEALPAIVGDIAKRLDGLAVASRVELDDSESLAELLVRMAHALLLVPDTASGGRTELGTYVQRHVSPMVRSAIHGEARGSSGPRSTRQRRRVRADLVAATLIAVLLGAAGWMAVVPRTAQPAVSPSNMTGTVPMPQEQRSPEAPPEPLPSPSVVIEAPPPPPPDVPLRVAVEPSDWTSVRATPPPSPGPGDSHGSNGSFGTFGPDGPDGPLMAGPRAGFQSGGAPSGPASTSIGPGAAVSARPANAPSTRGSAPSGAGGSKPDSRPGGGHPGGPG